MRNAWIAAVAVLLWTAGSAQAQGLKGPRGKWWHRPGVSEALELSEADKAKLDEKYLESRRRLIDLKGAVERERLELETLMEREPLDEGAVMGRYAKLDEARSRLTAERFRFLVEVRKILGLERFRKLKARFELFRKAVAGRRASRGPALRGRRASPRRGME